MSTNDKGSQWRMHETAERLGLTPPSKLVLNTQALARALNESPLDLSGVRSGGKINQDHSAPGTTHIFEYVLPCRPSTHCSSDELEASVVAHVEAAEELIAMRRTSAEASEAKEETEPQPTK